MTSQLAEEVSRLRWQAELLRTQADADLRRAHFNFVRTLRKTYSEHPRIARLAWWWWRKCMKRGWDGRRVC